MAYSVGNGCPVRGNAIVDCLSSDVGIETYSMQRGEVSIKFEDRLVNFVIIVCLHALLILISL